MRNLINCPLPIPEGKRVDKEEFYRLFQSTLALVSWGKDGASREAAEAANDIITICRAAIVGFAAKKDFDSVNEVISCFGMCSTLVIDVASSGEQTSGRTGQEQAIYDITYLPDGREEQRVTAMLEKMLVEEGVCQVIQLSAYKGEERRMKQAAIWGELSEERLLEEEATRKNVEKMLQRASDAKVKQEEGLT